MTITVVDILYAHKGLWSIIYTAKCDCGCKDERHIVNYSSKDKPTDLKAKQLANDDYNKQ